MKKYVLLFLQIALLVLICVGLLVFIDLIFPNLVNNKHFFIKIIIFGGLSGFIGGSIYRYKNK